jgi:hypothetical protein
MKSEESALCDLLDEVSTLRSDADVERYLELLGSLAASTDPDVLHRLLRALHDADAGEVQYELVEICERFPDPVYVRALLEELPGMWRRAPSWSRLMLQSVLNTPSSRSELERAIPSLELESRDSLLAALQHISGDDPRYLALAEAIASLL